MNGIISNLMPKREKKSSIDRFGEWSRNRRCFGCRWSPLGAFQFHQEKRNNHWMGKSAGWTIFRPAATTKWKWNDEKAKRSRYYYALLSSAILLFITNNWMNGQKHHFMSSRRLLLIRCGAPMRSIHVLGRRWSSLVRVAQKKRVVLLVINESLSNECFYSNYIDFIRFEHINGMGLFVYAAPMGSRSSHFFTI